MKKTGLKEKVCVIDIVCNICGKSCKKHDIPEIYEFMELNAHWGYYSNGKDCTSWEFDFFEDCSDKIMDFIKASGGK